MIVMYNALSQRLVQTIPSPRQIAHQSTEFYAFIHFTVNTFTDREWGDGSESPEVFAPDQLDAMQWAREIRNAGMRGIILTCKHHDGFCLWPSRYTHHTVASSPFRSGKGDVVREVSDACHALGLKFGIYLSPWDRNSQLYGQGKPYDDYFVHQLEELLTGYGDIFSVWLDGACGEGSNGKKQYYDWERYYETVRRLQPDACICVCGPDVRWCGNEAGDTREQEWSVVPRRMMDTEKIASLSQHIDDPSFHLRHLSARDQDLGSREVLQNEPDLIWYPAEVNTSIRPGWFWHEKENSQVRSLAELQHIYLHSVGGNATFLLNIPPDRRGLLHEADVSVLRDFGHWLKEAFGQNVLLTQTSHVTASSSAQGHTPEQALIPDASTFWLATEEQASFHVTWEQTMPVRYIMLMEHIMLSQRAEHFQVFLDTPSGTVQVADAATIGYKRILSVNGIPASGMTVQFLASRVAPTLQSVAVFI